MLSRSLLLPGVQLYHVIAGLFLFILQVQGNQYTCSHCGCEGGNDQQFPHYYYRYNHHNNPWPLSTRNWDGYSTDNQPLFDIRKKETPSSYGSQYVYHHTHCPHTSSGNIYSRPQHYSWINSIPNNHQNYHPDSDFTKLYRYSNNYFMDSAGNLYQLKQSLKSGVSHGETNSDDCSCRKRFCWNSPNYFFSDYNRNTHSHNDGRHQYWSHPNYWPSPNKVCNRFYCNGRNLNYNLLNSNRLSRNECSDNQSERNHNCDHSQHCHNKMSERPRQYASHTSGGRCLLCYPESSNIIRNQYH